MGQASRRADAAARQLSTNIVSGSRWRNWSLGTHIRTDSSDALTKYRELAKRGGWQPVPTGLKLKPGHSSAAVPAVARRLAATGDYTGALHDRDQTYGPELQEAVKRFQRRHGLEPDGTVGPAVVAAMNVPVADRISQIALNLERWRWLPRDLGERYVLREYPAHTASKSGMPAGSRSPCVSSSAKRTRRHRSSRTT